LDRARVRLGEAEETAASGLAAGLAMGGCGRSFRRNPGRDRAKLEKSRCEPARIWQLRGSRARFAAVTA